MTYQRRAWLSSGAASKRRHSRWKSWHFSSLGAFCSLH